MPKCVARSFSARLPLLLKAMVFGYFLADSQEWLATTGQTLMLCEY